jgi:seryl-tRNA synthetase
VTATTTPTSSADGSAGPGLPTPEELHTRLAEAGVLVATGIDGVYGRGADFESVATGVMDVVDAWGREQGARRVHFPPVVARQTFAQTNYIESFPDLMGSIHVFRGGDRDHAELLRRLEVDKDWPELLEPAEVVMASAACHPVYPLCAGRLPVGGRRFTVMSYCFRHEPSVDPARMQSFRMQEVVYVGDPSGAERHRQAGLEFGVEMLERLGLPMAVVPANDPFFGRLGAVLAAGQREEHLKMEGVTPITSEERPTAIMSGNCHRDHFSLPFGIETAQGERAHSACVAFGIERIVLALFVRHGFDLDSWPNAPRELLAL